MALPVVPKSLNRLKSKFLPKGTSIEFMPFTVGQESILLAVKDEDKDTPEGKEKRMMAIKQIIQECVKDSDYPVDKIPTFLLELLFLKIYSKSVGEIIEMGYTCKAMVDEAECNGKLEVKLDLEKVDLAEHEGHSLKVMLTDTIGVVFRYPDLELVLDAAADDRDVDMLLATIDYIFDGEDIHYAKDQPRADMQQWYKDLEIKHKRELMRSAIVTAPTINLSTEVACPKCGKVHKLSFTELADFFT